MSALVIRERHEYECGKALFPDLECGCWDGPRVTTEDVAAGMLGACQHPAAFIRKTIRGYRCDCGAVVTISDDAPPEPPVPRR